MRYLIYVILVFVSVLNTWAANRDDEKLILIITSYNPDMGSMQVNLEEFNEAYRRLDPNARIAIESLDCLYLKDAGAWNDRLNTIMGKYNGTQQPDMIVLLGQEAWSTYLSQDDQRLKQIPIMGGLISRNTIPLPPDSIDLASWHPASKDIRIDFNDFNIVGGYAYEYSLKDNIDMMRKLFPGIKNIAFLTDNTFGGVNMQSWIKRESSKYPEYAPIFIDGRTKTVDEASSTIAGLTPVTAIFCGTWRVDKSGEFLLGNTIAMLKEANPDIPVMTLSSVGMNIWAIGGFTPQYRTVGASLAHDSFNYLNDPESAAPVTIIPGQYIFDYNMLEHFGIDASKLPETANIINEPVSLYDQHKAEIWFAIIVVAILACALIMALIQLARINRLKHIVEEERNKVLDAMKKVEQVSDLKTKFIQNMSHEIRTPLNAIVGFAQVLSASLDESLQTYADVITKNSDDLLKMVNDIIVISDIDAGKADNKKRVSLNELCNVAYSQAEFKKSPNTSFRYQPTSDSLTVFTSKNLVEAALANLLHNAFKFTERGSVSMKCELSDDSKQAIVTVTDTGPGIPRDKQEWVFERFTKINEFKQGAGIGLALCRAVAKAIGGSVKIDSSYTGGCRIVFTFPCE
ncbi:MAG: HAMP domain-containing histidine kinase [Bacteroides sp.]|nr:HAMP domain-containing histidine kinase [Bacteroides sp.]MBD5285821.1 HAMP domain-containing histidine kinase [Bacteroides sp.]